MGGGPDARPAGMVAMNGPGDGARLLLTALLAGWALAYGYSLFALPEFMRPREAFDMRLDLGPALHFLGWQGVAGVMAVAVYGVSRLWPRGAAARQLGNLPLALAFLLLAVIAALVLSDSLQS